PGNGIATVNGDSTIHYEPEKDFYGNDQFDYRVTDVDGEEDIATVYVNVESVNDIPEAVDDNITIQEDTDTTVNVLENDNGLGDGIENLQIEEMPGNGIATVNGDSTIHYEPEKDFYGNDQFDYRVTDVDGEEDIATVYVNVESVNDIPEAVDDNIETNEDEDTTFNVLKNDNGLGDGGLSIEIIDAPENGNAEVTGDSTIIYSPDLDYYGEDSLIYEVRDINDETSTAKVYITVKPVDDHQPVANDDERGTEMNTPVEVDVLFNDTGLEDGDIRVFPDNANEPENGGIVEITENNTIIYEPDTDYTGTDDFDYEVYDRDNDVSTATVTIHVNEENNIPVANDDNAYTYTNTQVFIDVLANDENLEDGGIEVSEWTDPDNGEIRSIDSNYVQYMPDDDYTGNDRFTYLVKDSQGDYDTASVFIEVKDEENILPLANNDSVTTLEDTETTFDVLDNDGNLDDGIYKLTISEQPQNGKITNIEISGELEEEVGNISYNPNLNYYGQDSLIYKVCDLNNDCDEAKVIIDIEAVNDHQPVANDDSSGTSMNTPITVKVLMNDTGLEDGGIEIDKFSDPEHGNITNIDNENGTITYDPATDYLGEDTFEYQISDYHGDTDEANVKITVRENNLVPVANPDTSTTPKETPVEINVLDNDIAGDTSMSSMKVTGFINPAHGTIDVSEDSFITYTPDDEFTAGIDTFYYKVDDIDGDWDTAKVSVIVYDGYNHKPHAFDDYRSLDEDASPVFIHVLENDTALQDKPVALTLERAPLNGEVTEIEGDSAIFYQPDPDYFGTDSLTYKIRDINGDSDIANVYLHINPVDDGYPNARDDSTGTSQNTPVDINILRNDSNLKDRIQISEYSDPSHGSIDINDEDSTITYTPDTDYLGRDDFEYQICDYDDQCDEAKVIVEVRKDNIEPVAVPDSANTFMNQKVKIHVLNNDYGLDDGVGRVTLFDRPSNGNALVQTDNTVDYYPEEGYTGTDQFIYKVDDIDGDWDTAKVTLNIDTMANNIPVAVDDYRATEMDVPVEVDVLANDSSLKDEPLYVWITDEAENGEAKVPEGTNNVYYEPNSNFVGKDTLQYTVFDNDDDSDTAKVIINVKEENLIPVAVDDSAHTFMNHEVEIHVLNNDSLLQDGLDGIEIFSQAAHGKLEITQYHTIIYNPYKWYTGNDEFEYLVKDADGDVDVATVFVTIEETSNHVPNAQDDSTGTSINEEVTIDVLRNDKGLKDTPITLTQRSEPDHGSIRIEDDNTITYTPEKDYLGYDNFKYKVCDYDDECDWATVTIHVREYNTVPVALDDKVYTRMNTGITVNVLENDYGLDDGFGCVTIAQDPSYGRVEVNEEEDYSVTYTPNSWFVGNDTLVYELTDVDGDYDTAQVVVGVLDETGPLPDVFISEISGNTSENKTKAYFNMALQSPPESEVYIGMHSTDTTEGVISTDTVTFTPDNWDREQTVTVTGIEDNIVDGDIEYKILTGNAISSDVIYNNLTVDNINLINYDNDNPGMDVTLASETNRTSEDGDTVKLNITLETEPTAEVNIVMSSTDETEGIVENEEVVFKPLDSNLEQEINVIGVDDDEQDGDIEYEIEFSVSSEDTSYNNVELNNFILINEDNDEIEQFIPNAFSPDNDGINDRFKILGLEDYNNISIKVYNRWGSLVYSNNDYKNNWDGRANVSTLGNKKLPSGTYYYYLKIKDTGKTIEGSVFLKR
ncbi:MAG: Ig-like domain-containing protein, partial [Bacteroidales bacterium]